VELCKKYYRENKVLAVIPARKSSRRAPRKNVSLLGFSVKNPKPLVVWTFECAKKAENLDRIVVSTDDPEVKDLAEKYGIEVPYFPRKKELCEDVDTTLVILDMVKFLEEKEGYKPNYVCLLQPTSPFRLPKDIDKLTELVKHTGFRSGLTVTKAHQFPEWMFTGECEDGYLSLTALHEKLEGELLISQNLPEYYYPNGAVYVTATHYLLKRKRIFGQTCIGYEMPEDRSIDIETPLDFDFAETLLKKHGREWGLID
jgi:N-acylneuraminate cytidylyltransferase/CMP-N,N'-diacetyllegionaminic acid synthase